MWVFLKIFLMVGSFENIFENVGIVDISLFSKLMARLSEFHNWHNDACGRQDGICDDHVDITTGVTTRFLGGIDGDQVGYEGIRPATQVGPRTVESGLGGHDDGA